MNIPANRKLTPSERTLVPAEFLPPILAGQQTPTVQRKVERFYLSLEEMLERWITRRESPHTQRAYRQDIESLLKFIPLLWPRDSLQLLALTVADVQRWRDAMIAEGKAPKTINRRVSSVSSFFKYLQGVAAELRLPITVPNPAHAQFIARSSTDPIHETKHLSATRARQLMGLPQGEDLVAYRDRAILKWYVYSGVRLSTACKLNKGDVHVDGEETTVRISEKGDKHRTIGLHFAAAEAIGEYVAQAEIKRGALFRPRTSSNSKSLANKRISEAGMHKIVRSYLERLPGAMATEEDADGTVRDRCIYSTHSLRATTATLLLDAGVDICKVQELLGHRHVTTTQIYDKRRRAASDSASHDVPI
ncbi:MAG: tyrosine-type recombinase/integrase [Planctomycetota bacterium]